MSGLSTPVRGAVQSPLTKTSDDSICGYTDKLLHLRNKISESAQEINDCIAQYKSVEDLPEVATIAQVPGWRKRLLTVIRVQMSLSEEKFLEILDECEVALEALQNQKLCLSPFSTPSVTFDDDFRAIVADFRELLTTYRSAPCSIELRTKPPFPQLSLDVEKAIARVKSDLQSLKDLKD